MCSVVCFCGLGAKGSTLVAAGHLVRLRVIVAMWLVGLFSSQSFGLFNAVKVHIEMLFRWENKG